MIDYEKGVEAAADAKLYGPICVDEVRSIVDAFLSVQREVWWCEEHEQAACKWDSGGRSRCEPVFRGNTGTGLCRMVPKYLVDKR